MNLKHRPPLLATLQDGRTRHGKGRLSLVNEWEAPVRYRRLWTQYRSGHRVYHVRKDIPLARLNQ